MKKLFILAALAFVLLFSQTARANLVVNGDFQYVDAQHQANMWYGWTSNAYGVGWANGNTSAGFSYFPSAMSQVIPTVSGESYAFSFLLLHDSTGKSQNIAPYYAPTQVLQAFWDGGPVFTAPTANFLYTGNIIPYLNYDFVPYTVVVTATGPSTTIAFSGQDTGGYYWLDNVSVDQFASVGASQAVPEPATLLLSGFGIVGLAGIRRRFRN